MQRGWNAIHIPIHDEIILILHRFKIYHLPASRTNRQGLHQVTASLKGICSTGKAITQLKRRARVGGRSPRRYSTFLRLTLAFLGMRVSATAALFMALRIVLADWATSPE